MNTLQKKIGEWTYREWMYARDPTLALRRAIEYMKSNAVLYAPNQIDELITAIECQKQAWTDIKDTLVVKKMIGAKMVGGEIDHYRIVFKETSGRYIFSLSQPIGAARISKSQ